MIQRLLDQFTQETAGLPWSNADQLGVDQVLGERAGREVGCLVRLGQRRAVNDEDLDRAASGFELQTQLLLERSRQS